MNSYHNDPALKARFMGHIERHRQQDAFLRGTYGTMENGKFRGCAVGCSIRSLDEIEGKPFKLENGSHSDLAKRLGIPLVLARLEDCIFEGLPQKEAMLWPSLFASAIPVGKDLSGVWDKFAHWLLVGEFGVSKLAKSERSKSAIEAVASLYLLRINGELVSRERWVKARAAAYYYYDDVAYAAAYYDDVAYAAAYAAAAAAYDAAYYDDAAYAAAYYAAAAAAAVAAAAAAAVARSEARQRHYTRMAEKLLQIIGES